MENLAKSYYSLVIKIGDDFDELPFEFKFVFLATVLFAEILVFNNMKSDALLIANSGL